MGSGSDDTGNAKVLFFKSEKQLEAFLGIYSADGKFKVSAFIK